MDTQVSLNQDGCQNRWEYPATMHQPLSVPSGMWQGEINGMILTSVYDGQATFDPSCPPMDVPMNVNTYGQVWPIPQFPVGPIAQDSWSSAGQPVPSPLSEAPPYAWTPSPLGDSPADGERASLSSQVARNGDANSPAEPMASQPVTNLAPKHTETKKTTKRPAAAVEGASSTAAEPPFYSRPKHMLKRHKSDTPSMTSVSTPMSGGSASTTMPMSIATTTLGGVLPANVDPRVASEQIRREVWHRCKAEAAEMEQRRMMLLGHERGALERETQRLQVNLGLMREAAALRQRELEEEEKQQQQQQQQQQLQLQQLHGQQLHGQQLQGQQLQQQLQQQQQQQI
ncbi:hypothetical protein VTH06DRAFT_8254 [Thermothelomyces fergusii]